MRARKIKLHGVDFILLGENEGPITTKENYATGTCSFAHLYEDGNISRFGIIIGTVADIEFGPEIPYDDIAPTDIAAALAGLAGDSWKL